MSESARFSMRAKAPASASMPAPPTSTSAGSAPVPVPRLRGLLHAATFPFVLIAGFVLVGLAPTSTARLAATVYALTSASLFGVSAAYHRARPGSQRKDLLHRLDHANIYLVIAGTYTPITLLALHGSYRLVVLAAIWASAVAGIAFRVAWRRAPRWLTTATYIALGWFAVAVLPQLLHGAGVAALVLIVVGGILYSLGGAVYAQRWPDPSPKWFGFHEVFHAFTIAAYVAQYVAVSLVVYHTA